MVGQDWVADADMTGNSLIKAALCEDPVSGSQVLFAVQALFLERVKLGICSDSQRLSRSGFANCTDRGVIGGL
jgi:hypothetical protein